MRVVFGRPREEPASLFCGDAWMNVAEAWAAEAGLKIVGWQIDQKFRVGSTGVQLYSVTWTGKEWGVEPCA